ncbi:MAG: hypothetical protein ABFR65_11180, partial [Pseudomonadota bacterium]
MIKLFGVFVSKSIVLLGILELIVFFLSFHGAVFLHADYHLPEDLISDDRLTSTAALFASVMFSAMLSLGLYQPGSMVQTSGFLVRLFLAFSIGSAATGIIYYTLQDYFLTDRTLWGYSVMLSFLGVLTSRTIFIRLISDDTLKRRVLV